VVQIRQPESEAFMNDPNRASANAAILIENLSELDNLIRAAQDERVRAHDLRKAFELLQQYHPFDPCTKASLEHVQSAEYRAKDFANRVLKRMRELLLAAAHPQPEPEVEPQPAERAVSKGAGQRKARSASKTKPAGSPRST
jgi:DNA repair ATPase RecN